MGNRVGGRRRLELFDSLALSVGTLANTALYNHCPKLIAACRKRGDTLIGHGHTNSVQQGTLTELQESALLHQNMLKPGKMPPCTSRNFFDPLRSYAERPDGRGVGKYRAVAVPLGMTDAIDRLQCTV